MAAAAISVPSNAPYWLTVGLGVCGACGFALKELAGGKAPQGAPSQAVKRRYCPECGKQQPLTTKFCYECGAALSEAKTTAVKPDISPAIG